MSALACNYSGEPFPLPADASWWRVRRFRPGVRGRLDVVRDDAGQPLCLPVTADFAAFRAAVAGAPGRYRLDALDTGKMPMPDCDAAYATIEDASGLRNAGGDLDDDDDRPMPASVIAAPISAMGATVTAPFGTWPALPMPGQMTAAEYLLGEALRGQVMSMKILADALSTVAESQSGGAARLLAAGAEIVRAADGAHMPSRRPPPAPLPPPPVPPAPRNGWASDDVDADEVATVDDPAPEPSEPDMMDRLMQFADKVQGVITPVADVARMVRNVERAGLRNAGGDGESEANETVPATAEHLHTSHLVALSYELGGDGPRFTRLLRLMDPEDRALLTSRLCSLPLESAVAEATSLLARLRVRHATGSGGAPANVPIEATEATDTDDTSQGTETAAADHMTPPASMPVTPAAGGHPTSRAVAAPSAATFPGAPPATGAVSTTAGGDDLAHLTTAELFERLKPLGRQLKVSEVVRVQRLVGSLTEDERDTWLRYLVAMPIDQAVGVVRAELARRGA